MSGVDTTAQQVAGISPAVGAAFVLVLVVIIVLGGVVFFQQREIQKLKTPKYGFLGKSLNAFFAIAVLVGGIAFVNYTSLPPKDDNGISVSDEIVTLDGNIIVTLLNKSEREYKFNFIPYVNFTEWGQETDKFTIYWEVSGPMTYTDVETNVSKSTSVGITKKLQAGEYSVKVKLVYNNQNFEKTLNFNVQ